MEDVGGRGVGAWGDAGRAGAVDRGLVDCHVGVYFLAEAIVVSVRVWRSNSRASTSDPP